MRYRDKMRALQTETPTLVLGNQAHIFVIMGLSEELAGKLGTELYEKQITGDLPPNCRLIPYDVLFQSFAQAIPPQIMVLLPGENGDLASILWRVERNLFDWSYFDLTERSMEYWMTVGTETSSVLGSAPVLLDRSHFLVTNGPYSGRLATETDAPAEFLRSIVALLHRLRDATPPTSSFTTVDAFLNGYRWLVDRQAQRAASALAFTALKDAAHRCLNESRSEQLLTYPDALLAELEHHDLIDWAWMDSAGSRYLIHPAARLLL